MLDELALYGNEHVYRMDQQRQWDAEEKRKQFSIEVEEGFWMEAPNVPTKQLEPENIDLPF